jgi:hypothetical protein
VKSSNVLKPLRQKWSVSRNKVKDGKKSFNERVEIYLLFAVTMENEQ